MWGHSYLKYLNEIVCVCEERDGRAAVCATSATMTPRRSNTIVRGSATSTAPYSPRLESAAAVDLARARARVVATRNVHAPPCA